MGWAARAKLREMGRFRHLTADRCNTIGRKIRNGLDALGFTPPPEATVEQMAQDSQWLGTGPQDIFADGGRYHEDRPRFAKAFVRMEQAGRIADLLTWAQQIDGVRSHVRRWIEKRIDRIDTQDEQAQDYLFELELAGRLAKWPGLQIELAEPDILIRYTSDHPPMALACKRPRTPRSARRAIEEARDQIRASGCHGAIVIGTEAIFHRTENGSSAPCVFQVDTPAQAKAHGNELLIELAETVRQQPRRVFHKRVAGVFLCGILTYWSRRPSAYGYVWIRRAIPNLDVAYTVQTLEALDHLLFQSPN